VDGRGVVWWLLISGLQVSGDAPTETVAAASSADDPDTMVDEEGGNQWLYSCVVCGDGGDMVMCDACPRVYHNDCLDKEAADKVKRLKRWYCPGCTSQGLSHLTYKPKKGMQVFMAIPSIHAATCPM
jgi:hypothetical protein